VKRRRLFIITFGCIAAVILVFTLWPREGEPQYNGVPLSKWLERGTPYGDPEFTKAIKHIGTNALPVLVRSVDYNTPRWKFWLYFRVMPKLPSSIARSRPMQWLLYDKAESRADGAVAAFRILGSRATPVLDDLRRIASKRPMGFASEAISEIMSSIAGDFNEPPANLD